MSDLQEPNPNISALASLYPEGKYPSHIDIFGKGGFVSLNDEIGLSGYDDFINERIRFLRRKSGMLVYINSDESFHRCLTAGSGETNGQWKREYFTGRYFHGPAAPTADDLQVGERWFDTVVGTEYTYIPIAEGSTYLEWVDLDHLGAGRKYFYGLTAPEAGTDGDPLNIGDKWFNSTVGSEFTYLPTDGTLTGNKQWIDIDSPGSDEDILDIWVNESGDTMTGTLTGTDIYLHGSLSADKGFRGSFDEEFQDNEFITKQYVEDIYVNESGDTMTGTLTGTDINLSGSLSADRGFRQSDNPVFQGNEFVTRDSTLPQLTSTTENAPLGTVVPMFCFTNNIAHCTPLPGPGKWFVYINVFENHSFYYNSGESDEDLVLLMSKVWSLDTGEYLKFKLKNNGETTQTSSLYYAISNNSVQPDFNNEGADNYTQFTNTNALYLSSGNSPTYDQFFTNQNNLEKNGVIFTVADNSKSIKGYAIKISDTP